MKRQPFYAGTAPDCWLKTPRTGESEIRRAYPGIKCESESCVTELGHKAVQYLCAAIIGGCIAIVLFH